jgi:hypothetical protein
MKIRELVWLSVLMALIGELPAQAVSIYNPGTESCGSWASGQPEMVKGLKVAWLLGFVSGYNWYRSAEDVTSDVHGLVGWVDNYCVANPLDSIAKAAGRLIDELRRQRGLPPTMRSDYSN